MLTAVVGINWGDEGKGRMVDLLSEDYDVVCRYQGGNNAGHTVVNERGRFILNLLPSGILREGVVNVMGPGMVIDIEHLKNALRSRAYARARTSCSYPTGPQSVCPITGCRTALRRIASRSGNSAPPAEV